MWKMFHKFIYICFLLSLGVNTNKIKLKESQKLTNGYTNAIHFGENNVWISSSTGKCEVWKNNQKIKNVLLTGYINGQLFIDSTGSIINAGYFRYDLKNDKHLIYDTYAHSLLKYVDPDLVSYFENFEIKNSLVSQKNNRIILSLSYRPSRNGHDPKDPPRNILGLLNLTTGEVIKLLDQSTIGIQHLTLTENYLVGVSNQLLAWDLIGGKLVYRNDCGQVKNTSTSIQSDQVLITTLNGTILQYDLPNKKPYEWATITNAIQTLRLDESQLLVSDRQGSCHLVQKKKDQIIISKILELNIQIKDMFLHPDKTDIYFLVSDQKFPIRRVTIQ